MGMYIVCDEYSCYHLQVDVVLKLWRNGFSVDNGPLRDFHDPTNEKFLKDVTSGSVLFVVCLHTMKSFQVVCPYVFYCLMPK